MSPAGGRATLGVWMSGGANDEGETKEREARRALGLMIVAPGALATLVCKLLVADVPGGSAYLLTAYLGLVFGMYALILAMANESFSRRMSSRIAHLRTTRIADVEPGALVAVSGWVVQGEPVPRPVYPSEEEQLATMGFVTTYPPPPPEGCVTYPIVIEDGSGGSLRIPYRDGSAQPHREGASVHGGPYRVQLGERLFAIGVVEHAPVDTAYRASSASPALVRGSAPLFLVHTGSHAETVARLRRSEPSRVSGVVALALLALGIGAVVLAQLGATAG